LFIIFILLNHDFSLLHSCFYKTTARFAAAILEDMALLGQELGVAAFMLNN